MLRHLLRLLALFALSVGLIALEPSVASAQDAPNARGAKKKRSKKEPRKKRLKKRRKGPKSSSKRAPKSRKKVKTKRSKRSKARRSKTARSCQAKCNRVKSSTGRRSCQKRCATSKKARPSKVKARKTHFANIYMPGSVKKRRVAYQIRDGLAVTDGDILLGDPKTLNKRYGRLRLPGRLAPLFKKTSGSRGGSVISRHDYLWPNGTIHYLIGQSVHDHWRGASAKRKIRAAAAHLTEKTTLKLVEIDGPAEADNYIEFVWSTDESLCASSLGMQGGRQTIVCNFTRGDIRSGVVVHEILHAAGFNHTQKRTDRDNYITINPNNSCPAQFEMATDSIYDYCWADGAVNTQGKYDIKSIMHYSSNQCPKLDSDGRYDQPSMTDKKGKKIKSNRSRLSELDIEMIDEIYAHLPSTSRSEAELKCGDKNIALSGKTVLGADGEWETGKDGRQSVDADETFCAHGTKKGKTACSLGSWKRTFRRLPKTNRTDKASWCYVDKAKGSAMARLLCPKKITRGKKTIANFPAVKCTSNPKARKSATAKYMFLQMSFCTVAFSEVPSSPSSSVSSGDRARHEAALAKQLATECVRGKKVKEKNIPMQSGKSLKEGYLWKRGTCPYWYDTGDGGFYRLTDGG